VEQARTQSESEVELNSSTWSKAAKITVEEAEAEIAWKPGGEGKGNWKHLAQGMRGVDGQDNPWTC